MQVQSLFTLGTVVRCVIALFASVLALFAHAEGSIVPAGAVSKAGRSSISRHRKKVRPLATEAIAALTSDTGAGARSSCRGGAYSV